MRRKILSCKWLLILVLILTSVGNRLCLAETVTPAHNTTDHDYIVGCKDVLEVTVWSHEDLSAVVTVSEDGKISLTGLPEEVRVVGLTIPQVQTTLTEKLAHYLKDPKVTVTLKEARTIQITVVGSVRSPGVYSFRTKPTLVDALASAGGYMPEADLTYVKITRIAPPNSTADVKSDSIIVDLNKLLTSEEKNNLKYDIILQDGDVIYVPEKAKTVSVLGDVQRPGIYDVDTVGPGTRLYDIIAAAGGPGINADTSCVKIIRYTENGMRTIEICLDAMESESSGPSEQYDGTFKLLPGDVVYVPEAIRVQVLGQVTNPGNYQLKAKSTFVHSIAQAGGTLDSADTTCISLHRDRGDKTGIHVLNLDAALSGKLPREELILQDQDTLIIPELVREVSVLGAVNRPGIYRIDKDTRILQVLAMAGWVAQDGDGASAVLTRRLQSGETQHVPVNLEKLQNTADEKENHLLAHGDIIYVPRAITVMVLGQVKVPGTYILKSTSRLMDALFRAGGVLPEGDLTKVSLTRNGDRPGAREIDVKAVMTGANKHNVDLLDEDIIFVPELIREVSVLGEVAHPGIYKIGDDTTLLECLAQAGGITETGDATSIRLTRRSPDGTFDTYTINLEEIHDTLDTETWILVSGDNIYVPRP